VTTTKERPILFSGPMVRAILAGEKTQTRRVVRPQPENNHCATHYEYGGDFKPRVIFMGGGEREVVNCPYGQPGGRLWVRETCRFYFDGDDYQIQYRADDALGRFIPEPEEGEAHEQAMRWIERAQWGECEPGGTEAVTAWRPSIHVPRWASRITLEVTEVRVERLQEMDKRDEHGQSIGRDGWHEGFRCPNPMAAFIQGWDELNGKRGYSWESNPWVWVVEFTKET
jgi:hypothetical protein